MQDQEFLKTKVNYGVILRATLQDVEGIKKLLLNFPDVYIVYQKVGIEKLWIVKDGEGAGQGRERE